MTKRKGPSYETKMMNALNNLPNPLEDLKHNLVLYFPNNRARSNETRFEHYIKFSHKLLPSDIKYIPEGIKKAKLKKDKLRKWTYEYTFIRKCNKNEYIKICIQFEKDDAHVAKVKTIFVSKKVK